MFRLFLLLVFTVGGAWYVKVHEHPVADHRAQNQELLPSEQGNGQDSHLLAFVTALLGHGQTPAGPVEPVTLPTVTTPRGIAGSPSTTSSTVGGRASTAEVNIPPELLKFINPSLLTTTPAGTRELSPAAWRALQQIIAQARANPNAFAEQYAASAKALRGQQ